MFKSWLSAPALGVALLIQSGGLPAQADADPTSHAPQTGEGVVAGAAPTPATGQTEKTPASDQRRSVYLTGALGGNWPQPVKGRELTNFNGDDYRFTDDHFSGPSIEVGLGYDFGAFRAEATYVYDRSELRSYSDQDGRFSYSGGTVAKNSILASLYWDIDTRSRFIPYLGGGIGYAALRVDPSLISPDASPFVGYTPSGFGYQAKVGISYVIDNRSDAFAEAVYRGMSSYDVSDGPVVYRYANYNSWGFQLGARVRF